MASDGRKRVREMKEKKPPTAKKLTELENLGLPLNKALSLKNNQLDSVKSLDELKIPPGNFLKLLSGCAFCLATFLYKNTTFDNNSISATCGGNEKPRRFIASALFISANIMGAFQRQGNFIFT